MIAGTSNGVNLTDGLDGLATGASRDGLRRLRPHRHLAGQPELPDRRRASSATRCATPRDLAVVAAAVMGACFGFLWWNASPAKIFMGDTGSLALGGALAGLAITTRTELLLVILGGLFVIITLSVIIQVGSFKLTGKRVFRMAPLQHHFELLGLGRGHHRHPVLDHRRAVRRAGSRPVLRRVGGGRSVSVPSGCRGRTPRRPPAPPPTGAVSRVVVAGLGVSGFAAADALHERGARVVAVDGAEPGPSVALTERARILDILGVDVRARPEHVTRYAGRPAPDLVVTSPGLAARPARCSSAAAQAGIPVWGEVELAWRMRAEVGAAPWLTITGTNGKTTTVQMLASMLRAAGLRATAAGNVGTPDPRGRPRTPSPTTCSRSSCPASSCTGRDSIAPATPRACLNVAPDHVDWHGSLEDVPARQGQGLRAHQGRLRLQRAGPGHRAAGRGRRRAGRLPRDRLHPRHPGPVDGRASSTTSSPTGRSSSSAGPRPPSWPPSTTSAAAPPTAGAAQPRQRPRGGGAGPGATAWRRWRSATGCGRFTPDPHRIADCGDGRRGPLRRRLQGDQPARGRGVAARVRARRLDRRAACSRAPTSTTSCATPSAGCAGVVLIGADRARLAEALARHAPDVPVVEVSSTDTGVMETVVARAAELAQPGDVVLLAPAAASMDMFPNYGARGDAFAAAVARRAGSAGDVAVSSATAAPPRARATSRTASTPSSRAGSAAGSQRLDSPVTSYYVLLSVTVVLVVIGLIMVLSASSVESLVQTDNATPYVFFRKQLAVRRHGRDRHGRRPSRDPAAGVEGASAVPSCSARCCSSCSSSPRSACRSTATATGSSSAGRPLQPSEVAKVGARPVGAAVLAAKRSCSAGCGTSSIPSCSRSAAGTIGLVLLGHDLGTVMVMGGIVGGAAVRGRGAAPDVRLRRRALRAPWP